MIEITIKQTKYWTTKAKKSMLTKETPTQVVKETVNYSNRTEKEVQFEKEYVVQEVDENQSREFTLLKQEIPTSDEGSFDLKAVIRAINGMQGGQ